MWVGQYILDADGNPQPEPDTVKWAMWYEHSARSTGKDNRILQHDHIGSVLISTIFLGLDHAHPWSSKPVLWETMIFGGEHGQYMDRYTSRDDAMVGHTKAVEMVKASQADLCELERMAKAGRLDQKMNQPEWLRNTTAYLASKPGEMTAEQIAQHIHHALVIAEAEKYATEKSRFIFGLSGATSEDIAEIWRHLTPFERTIVVIQNVVR